MQNLLHSVGEFITPTLKESNFSQTGRLTPKEFVLAGDFLVHKCPTWQWSSGDPQKERSFLPKDKQFLITRNVPSLSSKKNPNVKEDVSSGVDRESDFTWINSSLVTEAVNDATLSEINDEEDTNASEMERISLDCNDEETIDCQSTFDEDIPDLETFSDDDNVINPADDPSLYHQIKKEPNKEDNYSGNIMKTRTFDIYITYDKYYQTPRLWLTGYDEEMNPLPSYQIFDDISGDHAHKTVTIETHPHLNLSLASIHPCKHAHVMKRILMFTKDSGREIRVDQYLITFLKFISTVLPTIDYDFTMSV